MERVVQDPLPPSERRPQTPLLPIHARGSVIQGAAWAPGCRGTGGRGSSRRSLSIQAVPRNGVSNLIFMQFNIETCNVRILRFTIHTVVFLQQLSSQRSERRRERQQTCDGPPRDVAVDHYDLVALAMQEPRPGVSAGCGGTDFCLDGFLCYATLIETNTPTLYVCIPPQLLC